MNQSKGYLTATEAAELLGVKVETLYAYVSRGLLESHPAPGPGRQRRYLRSEVEDLRQGRSRIAESLRWGEPLIESAVSWITPEGPVYRGIPVIDLLDESFETVAELLWTGEQPSAAPLWPVPDRAPDFELPASPSLAALSLLVTTHALSDPERFVITPAATLARSRRLIAAMTGAPPPTQGERVASLLAASLGVDDLQKSVAALDRALILLADHEMNASTFTVRVVASTGSDIYACISAGLAALSGPRHGGAGERVGVLLDEIRQSGTRQAVLDRLRRGEDLPGFGHRLYPNGDPRFGPLFETASRIAPESPIVDMSAELIEVATEAELPQPNVDLGLAVLVAALGLSWTATGWIFAVGRTAGWVAHALEQYQTGILIRPRARRG